MQEEDAKPFLPSLAFFMNPLHLVGRQMAHWGRRQLQGEMGGHRKARHVSWLSRHSPPPIYHDLGERIG